MLAGFRSRCSTPLVWAAAKSGAELARDVERLIFGQASDAPQQRSQVFAVDIFHGEEGVALDVAHVVDAANVGMRDPPRDPHFILESARAALGRVRPRREET